MSPFEVYCIMQADVLGNGIAAVAVVLGLVVGILSLVGTINYCCGVADKDDEALQLCATLFRWVRRLALPFVVAFIAAILFPSTKTLCAMYAVPVIVNNETLHADLGEVYSLGMERLKDVLTPETPENN